jgi:hypothetical protein
MLSFSVSAAYNGANYFLQLFKITLLTSKLGEYMGNQAHESFDNPLSSNGRRWYDKDPVLSKAIKTLENSDDQLQIQIALNLIKIIIEHKIELLEFTTVDDLITSVKEAKDTDEDRNSRWYDLNDTLRAAMIMLESCPEDMRTKMSKDIAEVITRIIKQNS